MCNFQGGAGDSGNEVWWNGGDGSGKVGLAGYSGSYLTGTTSFFGTESTAAAYGIFSSNAQGPGSWNQIYGSNMNDSGMYVGACLQVCDVTIDHAWMENNALGYSGTNSGGSVVIENSQFDNNEDGVDTNTQIAGDPPPPQNGACPHGGTSPITHTQSCWVFIHNNVHDNNNPDVPAGRQRGRRPDRHGHDAVGRAQRHRDGQHVRQQRRLGDPVRPVPGLGHTVAQPEMRELRRLPDERPRMCLRGHEGDSAGGQHLRQRRLLRQPDQRRLRPDRPPQRPALQLLRRPTLRRREPRRPTSRCCSPRVACRRNRPISTARWSPRSSATPAWRRARRGRTTRRRRACISSRCRVACRRCPTRAPACLRTRGALPVRRWPVRRGTAGHGGPVSSARVAAGVAYLRAAL